MSVAADLIWRERPDLAAAFPHVRWGDRDNFLRWLWIHGLEEGLISTALLPDLPGAATPVTGISTAGTDGLKFGVNLVGYHDSDLGLGVAVRRVGAALDAAGIPWMKVSYDRTHSRRRSDGGGPASAAAPYRYNLILIAPDQLAFFVYDVGTEFFAGHYNIGLWYWETDVLSERQRAALDLVDEVWGATQYLADVFAAHTDKPVVRVPVPLEFRQGPRYRVVGTRWVSTTGSPSSSRSTSSRSCNERIRSGSSMRTAGPSPPRTGAAWCSSRSMASGTWRSRRSCEQPSATAPTSSCGTATSTPTSALHSFARSTATCRCTVPRASG
ncbi:MAG: hypothetical protein V9G12_19335 [Microthrixaceae bacterium]